MIYINDIPSFRAPEEYSWKPDDRIEKVEIIGGYVVQDFGHIEEGDTASLKCLFTETNFNRVKALWESRSFVSFTDTNGQVFNHVRLVFGEYKRDPNFPGCIFLNFELWRV